MSRNLVVFLMIVSAAVFYVHRSIKSKIVQKATSKIPTTQVEKSFSQESIEDDDKKVEEVFVQQKSTKSYINYPSKTYSCPERIKVAPYALSGTQVSNGPFYNKVLMGKLDVMNATAERISCEYSISFDDMYYVYENVKGYNCKKIQNKHAHQCYDADNKNKKISCWEMRTSRSKEPYLRFEVKGVDIQISEDEGWEFIEPKGFLQTSRIRSDGLFECGYQFNGGSSLVLENEVVQFKECYRKGNSFHCS